MSDVPDVSVLESQVAALTAAQLDTQYSDNYNIVRAGAPTRSNESEEPHHE